LPAVVCLRLGCQGIHGDCMKSGIVDAVLKAADEWVLAQEALLAAKQISEKTDAEQEAVDIAGSLLVVAVTRWRSSSGRTEN
jgi:hypothetical protein